MSILASVALGVSTLGFLLIFLLIIANLFTFWIVSKGEHQSKRLMVWVQNISVAQVLFSLLTSLLSSGLGFFSWIFLFEPESMVRNVLFQLGPVLVWGLVVTAYLLTVLSNVLNSYEKDRDGLLVGTVLFSVVGYVFLFWMSAKIFPYTINDAYITFRYSKNLAAGFGPTYNPGFPLLRDIRHSYGCS